MKKQLFIVLAVLGLLATGCNGDSFSSAFDAGSPYAAMVNGHAISQNDLNAELEAIKANGTYLAALSSQTPVVGDGQGTFDAGFASKVLNRQITYAVISQAVSSRHLDITPADLTLARADAVTSVRGSKIFDGFPLWYQKVLTRRAAQVTALEANLIGANVSQPAIAQYYQAHQSSFVITCVRHILVTTQASANAIYAEIAAGANFAQLARTQSIDSGSASSGGDLGCGAAGRFIPQFESAMNALPVGVVSSPVQTQYGWHIIQVTQRHPEALAQASSQIRASLLAPSQKAFSNLLEGSILQSHVYVNPRYGHYVDTGPSVAVNPPSPPSPAVVPASLAPV
ncbi:MAG: peptidylprolyl isomerase, partial [Acidimicrobiales bacterium]